LLLFHRRRSLAAILRDRRRTASTYCRGVARGSSRPLPRDEARVDDGRAPCARDGPPSHDRHCHGGSRLAYDAGLHVRDVPPLFDGAQPPLWTCPLLSPYRLLVTLAFVDTCKILTMLLIGSGRCVIVSDVPTRKLPARGCPSRLDPQFTSFARLGGRSLRPVNTCRDPQRWATCISSVAQSLRSDPDRKCRASIVPRTTNDPTSAGRLVRAIESGQLLRQLVAVHQLGGQGQGAPDPGRMWQRSLSAKGHRTRRRSRAYRRECVREQVCGVNVVINEKNAPGQGRRRHEFTVGGVGHLAGFAHSSRRPAV
jgi:hypothetical protein